MALPTDKPALCFNRITLQKGQTDKAQPLEMNTSLTVS